VLERRGERACHQRAGQLAAVARGGATVVLRVGANFNPAISLGLLVVRRITPQQAGTFLCGQLIGALLAAFTLKAVFPSALWESARGARQLVSLDVSTAQAFTLEAIASALVMFAYMGTISDAKGPKVGGLAVGMAAAIGMIAIGPLTGAGMNPARSIGPMIVSRAFEGLALYLTAPIVGAIVAAVTYRALLLDDASA
jgi:glycerol uptake facilitator-like aquaporin